jgi:V/A-type H+/Na+-transporting ATPase subunit C
MKETDYVYAVARIRANEIKLLNGADIEQLIAATSYENAVRILDDKGFMDDKNNEDVNYSLKQQANKTWQLLSEIAPDISELEFLIVKNDYHNIKAALKALVSDIKDLAYFVEPSIIKPDLINDAILNKKFNELLSFARDAAEETYEVLIRTMDGQITDIMIDVMALNNMILRAEKSDNNFIKKLVELICVTANIKTALRAARTGKDEQFLETALCQTKTLDKSALVNAAKKGSEEFLQFLSSSAYSEAAEYIKISTTSFEKWCDDILMSHIESAKLISFGIEPLIAYYIAKDAEIKTVRIILSCKHNNLSVETIKERVRKLYV